MQAKNLFQARAQTQIWSHTCVQRWAPASCNRCFPSESWKRRRWHAIIAGNAASSQQRCITAAHKTEQHVFTGELTHLSWPVSSHPSGGLRTTEGAAQQSHRAERDYLWGLSVALVSPGRWAGLRAAAAYQVQRAVSRHEDTPTFLEREGGGGRATTLLYVLVSVYPALYQNVNPPEREKLKTCFLRALWHKRKRKKSSSHL